MLSEKLLGKVALVTGASRGIGRSIALRLAEDGAAIAVNYAGNVEKAQEVVSKITQAGGKAIAIPADVSQVSELQRLFNQTFESFGRLDILVNNAGTNFYKPIAQFTEAEFDQMFNLNVKATFFACQQAAQRLADGGRIINISSSTTQMMMPTASAYTASKAAVNQLTRIVAKELGARGITVNAVSPGPTNTDLFNDGKSEAQLHQIAQMTALGGIGKVEDIADVVAFLASEEARWITGQNIFVNGGMA